MFNWYAVLEFLHVTAVIVWVGGVIALTIINRRLREEGDPAATRAIARQSAFFGRAVLGPAAGLTLLAGVALMAISRSGFTLWLGWGLAGVFGSVALGATVLRRETERVIELTSAETPDPGRLAAARRRLSVATLANILLLLSTVWAMVFKPTL